MIVNSSMMISLYFIYQWILDSNEDPENVVPIELWDYVHLFILLFNRAIVIATKYGTFSDQRFEILRKVKLGLKFLNDKLLLFMILKNEPEFIERSLIRSFKHFEIEDKKFTI